MMDAFLSSFVGYARWVWYALTHPSWDNFLLWLVVLSIIVWSVEIIVPWRKKQPIFRKDFWLDAWYMVFNVVVFSLVGYHALSHVVSEAVRSALLNLTGWESLAVIDVSTLPVWSQLLLMFILRDFIQWNVHILLHRVPWLWEFHKVHHSVEQMGFAAHLRFHWMETIVYRVVEYLPLSLLGFGISEFLIVHVIALAIGHLNHANVRLPIGKLIYVINSPQMHIWHHAKEIPEGSYGVNYGLSLSIWDWLFGTAWMPKDGRDIQLGFENVERYPTSFWQQMIAPFRRST